MAGNWDDDSTTPVASPHGRSRWNDQWSFTAPFEGIIPHIYKDSLGLITCGVGFLIPNVGALSRFPWFPSLQDAVADYKLVEAEPYQYKTPAGQERVRTASHYRQFCKARLTEPAMRAVFNARIADIRKLLHKDWQLARCPEQAQVALIDMAYNLGVGGLNRFVKLRAAVLAQDWATAAKECNRRGIQQPRNDATAELFRGLAGERP